MLYSSKTSVPFIMKAIDMYHRVFRLFSLVFYFIFYCYYLKGVLRMRHAISSDFSHWVCNFDVFERLLKDLLLF